MNGWKRQAYAVLAAAGIVAILAVALANAVTRPAPAPRPSRVPAPSPSRVPAPVVTMVPEATVAAPEDVFYDVPLCNWWGSVPYDGGYVRLWVPVDQTRADLTPARFYVYESTDERGTDLLPVGTVEAAHRPGAVGLALPAEVRDGLNFYWLAVEDQRGDVRFCDHGLTVAWDWLREQGRVK